MLRLPVVMCTHSCCMCGLCMFAEFRIANVLLATQRKKIGQPVLFLVNCCPPISRLGCMCSVEASYRKIWNDLGLTAGHRHNHAHSKLCFLFMFGLVLKQSAGFPLHKYNLQETRTPRGAELEKGRPDTQRTKSQEPKGRNQQNFKEF
jgi:hypothetical protein